MSRPGPVLVSAEGLSGVLQEAFAGAGISTADAAATADVLVEANLRGLDSHGVERAPIYLKRLQRGLSGGTDRVRVVADTGVMCRLDARHALGPAAAVDAVDRAVASARELGIGLVAMGNATHFGPAGYYARRAALTGLVAVVTSNAAATMPLHGGAQRFIGANPLAIGVPLGELEPFVLDFSASIVARGRIRRAARTGQPLEPGLAVDEEGRPTRDATEALAGMVLPFAGVKGSGLALALDLLAGVLAGAAFDDEMGSMYSDLERPQRTGQIFLVIDPWQIADRQDTARRLGELVDRLHAMPTAPGFDRVLYSGERGAESRVGRLRDGIPVEPQDLEALAGACESLGLSGVAQNARALGQE